MKKERSYKTVKAELDRVFSKNFVYMKNITIFAVLTIRFAFSTQFTNATGFNESFSLRSGLSTVNEGGFIIKTMWDKKKYKKEYYLKNRKHLLSQAIKYYNIYKEKKPKKLKICPRCKKEFYTKSSIKIYCTINCTWRHRNEKEKKGKITKQCKYCQINFEDNGGGKTYCSDICCNKYWKEKQRGNKYRKCLFCNKIFEWTLNHRKFCEPQCYKEYWKIHPNRNKRDKERQRQYQKWYVKSTPEKILHYQLSDRIRKHLRAKGLKKDKYLRDVLGCSVLELIKRLENQFETGMSWDNHRIKGWHIDHKIPLCTAKNKKEVYKLWHYSNLQPLWAIDNLKKGGKTKIIQDTT